MTHQVSRDRALGRIRGSRGFQELPLRKGQSVCPVERPTRSLPRPALLFLAAALSAAALAQTSQPEDELPEDVRAALEETEDFSFSFSQPGFYAVLEYVKTMSGSPGQERPALEIDDWTALLERPADFRGLPVAIEGVVGRNKPWRFEQPERRHLGTVWQLELWRADQATAATLILTDNADDIPIGATIRVTGYFVMIRQYHGGARQLRQAALLVGHGPTLVTQTAPPRSTRPVSNLIVGLLATATAALLITWVLLRRTVRRTRSAEASPLASGPAPISLADDLAEWAAKDEEPPPEEDHPDTDRP